VCVSSCVRLIPEDPFYGNLCTTVSLFANTTDPTVALPQTLHIKVVIE